MTSKIGEVLRANYKPIWYNVSETKPATVNTQLTKYLLRLHLCTLDSESTLRDSSS